MVDFRANLAAVRDERDLIACLRHPGVQVDVVPEYVDWIAGVMNQCGTAQPPKALVRLPAGFSVVGEPGSYEVAVEGKQEYVVLDETSQFTEEDFAKVAQTVAGRMANGHKGDCGCPWCNKLRREWVSEQNPSPART
jgi:hypothetical protein